MDRKTVKQFLNCNYPELVDLALTYARLTDKQREVINLCFMRGMTQEEAAEEIGYDISTVRRRHDKAMQIMSVRFDHLPWIYKVI